MSLAGAREHWRHMLERGCSKRRKEHGLTKAQLASLRVNDGVFVVRETASQRRTSTIRRLRDQIGGQLADATQRTKVSFGVLLYTEIISPLRALVFWQNALLLSCSSVSLCALS